MIFEHMGWTKERGILTLHQRLIVDTNRWVECRSKQLQNSGSLANKSDGLKRLQQPTCVFSSTVLFVLIRRWRWRKSSPLHSQLFVQTLVNRIPGIHRTQLHADRVEVLRVIPPQQPNEKLELDTRLQVLHQQSSHSAAVHVQLNHQTAVVPHILRLVLLLHPSCPRLLTSRRTLYTSRR